MDQTMAIFPSLLLPQQKEKENNFTSTPSRGHTAAAIYKTAKLHRNIRVTADVFFW